MKTLALAIATTALTATVASAGVGISNFDQNGDRFASKAEVSAVFPGLTSADFRNIDQNDDRRLSANELLDSNAQTIFGKHANGAAVQSVGKIDGNGDGFASWTELAAAYPGFRATDFDDLDLNDDRRVSANELYESRAQQVLSRYQAGFMEVVTLSSVDVDGSNFVSFAELSGVYPGVSNVDFDTIDANGDNRISFNELYANKTLSVLGRSGS